MRFLERLTRSKLGRGMALTLGTTVVAVGVFAPFTLAAAPSNFVDVNNHQVRYSGTGSFDWANSGAAGGTNTCAPGEIHVSGTNGLFDCGVFNGATTPPTPPRFIASDPSITPGGVTFTADPLSVDHTTCALGSTAITGDPTTYTGAGSEKNGTLLSTDTWGNASVPNKDDLNNVYAVGRRIDSGGVPTTYEVFFGGERVVNNGDSHIDYEFLQSSVSIVPNVKNGVTDPCNGTFSGDRTQGDLLLSVDFTTGGTFGGTQLYEWHCNADPGTQPADGHICNPPAHGQSVPHYQPIGSDSVNFGVNDALTAISCGGWACRNADGTQAATIATNELMEGGINLKDLGFTGCLGTFLPHTRSAQQFTATLKDFAVIPFNTCNPSTTMAVSTTPTSTNGSVLVHKGDSVAFSWTETNDGNVSLTSPSISVTSSPTGATCTPTKTGGDTNSNSILDAGEAWVFGCSVTFNTAGSYTLTAIGHGTFNGNDVTYCSDPANPPSGVKCDQQERTVSTVRVIAPATTLTKTPSAPTIHSGDSVTYTYTEANGSTGGNGGTDLAISSPSVTDDSCTPVAPTLGADNVHNVGDTNTNGKLDAGETWTFTCATTLSSTTTNVAKATGTDALGFAVTWCADPNSAPASTICSQTERASATVTVINPGTALAQTAVATVNVTYTYKESNTGDTPLSSVNVTDPNCGTVSPTLGADGIHNIGDTNKDGKLDTTETWTFTCTKTAAVTVDTDPGTGTSAGPSSFQDGASATGTDQLGAVINPANGYTDEQHSTTVTVSLTDNGHTLP